MDVPLSKAYDVSITLIVDRALNDESGCEADMQEGDAGRHSPPRQREPINLKNEIGIAAFGALACDSAHPLKMERPIKKVTNYKKAEAHNRERGCVGGGRNEMK
ncbi:unnamed protein product [Danaus chrysippus]|uniref:(African queen) hypothetical protein n=1 Tax=Danaus chrysippus TaxID=151541 RepID=A0A8J2QJI7_9NEOP|nr:unnamed protein product [Danaus chrysippus]